MTNTDHDAAGQGPAPAPDGLTGAPPGTLERIRKRLSTGLLLAIPALVTFWVIELTLELAVAAGEPLAVLLAGSVRPISGDLADLLVSDGLRWAVAIMLMLGLLYALGSIGGQISGRRLLDRLEARVLAVPGIDLVYGAVRDLINSFKQEGFEASRVVLIEFPGPHMRTIGFVTRTFTDSRTGRPLAAVYVPTTPNPTSGYIEIVPCERLVWLDWTPQEAMRFVVSGGVAGPDSISFERADFTAGPDGGVVPTRVAGPSADAPEAATMPEGEFATERSSIQVRADNGVRAR